MNEDVGTNHRRFQTTDWGLVDAAGRTDTDAGHQALETVLRRYYGPLQAHLVTRFQVTEDQAADWLQDFVHQKVLVAGLLRRANRSRGRFRTFLLFTLDRFVIGELRRAKARRRMPKSGIESLDELSDAEVASRMQRESTAIAPHWAGVVIHETLRRVEAECAEKGCPQRWGVFKARLLDVVLDGAEPLPYKALVQRYGFRSPAEASNTFTTATRMFHRLLRQVVGEYAGQGADVEAEICELLRELGGHG